jgi:hypothetical protein
MQRTALHAAADAERWADARGQEPLAVGPSERRLWRAA